MKRKTKTILIASIAFVVLLVGAFIWRNVENTKLKFSIDASKVSLITITDGSAHGWKITERADIEHIVNNFNSITFTKYKSAADRCGGSFGIAMLDKDRKELWSVGLNSPHAIILDDYFYIDNTSTLDYAYIVNLTKTMKPDS